ncbi:MAG: Gfo/Idh/MocA family oxidoreductase [Williamsia sp.]|nr:Gfo/Idh/MocA family oxidoreductase [Williamsia sp.]
MKLPFRSFLLGLLACFCVVSVVQAQVPPDAPLRIVIVGATHGHVPFLLGRKNKEDVVVVGIYEPNRILAERLAKNYHLDTTLLYTDLNKMLDAVKPEAAAVFGSIYEHMKAVEVCAPRGIHIMVEKPLATNVAHAEKMLQLAKQYKIHLLTDFETSWYPTTQKTYQLVNDSNFVGSIRKVVIHDGHQGPKEIRVNQEFFDWLTDPVQNGGGALVDFGCYGANLMTWLMRGQQPVSVTAVTQHFKPAVYPKVEDEATIIVSYPSAQCIIQASWNWPFSRKDMEVYGETGYVITANNTSMRVRNANLKADQSLLVTEKDVPVYTEPFAYFKDVIRNKIKVPEWGLYSLENNLMVVRILEAARESAKTGKTVYLKK